MADSPPKNNRFRFSLKTLIYFISFLAIALSALKYPTAWWATGLIYTTFLMLLVSAVCGVYLRSRWGAFAGGFAIGGVAWLGLLVAFSQLHDRTTANEGYGYSFGMRGNTNFVNRPIPNTMNGNPLSPDQLSVRLSFLFHPGYFIITDEFLFFRIIAGCLATWLIGLLSGIFARFLWSYPQP